MLPHLTLHHYGFLTADTAGWLAENELLFGKPFLIQDTICISSQKVNITFLQQKNGDVFMELIEPWEDNKRMQKMLEKGITIYHSGYMVAPGLFNEALAFFEENHKHTLPTFSSEAFNAKQCAFIITDHLGMLELIES